MKIKKNGKIIRLTESDLKIIVKRVLNEQGTDFKFDEWLKQKKYELKNDLEYIKRDLEHAWNEDVSKGFEKMVDYISTKEEWMKVKKGMEQIGKTFGLNEQMDLKFDMNYQPEIYRGNRENQIKKAEEEWMTVKKGVEKMLDAITIIDKKDSQSYKMIQRLMHDFKIELDKKGDKIIQQMKKEPEL